MKNAPPMYRVEKLGSMYVKADKLFQIHSEIIPKYWKQENEIIPEYLKQENDIFNLYPSS